MDSFSHKLYNYSNHKEKRIVDIYQRFTLDFLLNSLIVSIESETVNHPHYLAFSSPHPSVWKKLHFIDNIRERDRQIMLTWQHCCCIVLTNERNLHFGHMTSVSVFSLPTFSAELLLGYIFCMDGNEMREEKITIQKIPGHHEDSYKNMNGQLEGN